METIGNTLPPIGTSKVAPLAHLTWRERVRGLRRAMWKHRAIYLLMALPLLYFGCATWLHSSGQYAEAEEYYRKCIAIFRQMGVEDFATEPLGRFGQMMLEEGRVQEAYDLNNPLFSLPVAGALDSLNLLVLKPGY